MSLRSRRSHGITRAGHSPLQTVFWKVPKEIEVRPNVSRERSDHFTDAMMASLELAEYGTTWRVFRRLRVAFMVLLAGFFPFEFALLRLQDLWDPFAILFASVLYLAAFGAIAMEWGGTRCPRCGDLFLRGNYITFRFWSSSCYRCGLRVGAVDSPPAKDES